VKIFLALLERQAVGAKGLIGFSCWYIKFHKARL
jgi:hypothetical protein